MGGLVDVFISLGLLNLLHSLSHPSLYSYARLSCSIHKGKLKFRVSVTYLELQKQIYWSL